MNSTKLNFDALALSVPVLKAVDEAGYKTPSPIQEQTIPLILEGRDVLGQAQTGTGKTAAFALPLLSCLDLSAKELQVLVLVPTRELALQVSESFARYAAHLENFEVLAIYGGQGYSHQLKQLKSGVHVVVGTPGRVMDHMRRGTLKLEGVQCLVLDEADEMLRMGFLEDIEWILEHTPANRQTTLFSATIPQPIKKIAQRYLRNPQEISIEVRTTAADTINQRFCTVHKRDKFDVLTRILEAESLDGTIIFAKTKVGTIELAEQLEAHGHICAPLNGDIPQSQRERTVDRFKSGRLDILVATDVAARGLDIDRVSHIINFDMPDDAESYVHRIGRTGRAGRTGEAILFVTPREKRMLNIIERATRQKIAMMELPTIAQINDKRIMRFKQRITDVLTRKDLGFFQELAKQYHEEHEIPVLDIAAALASLVQGDKPLLLTERPQKRLAERPRSKENSPKKTAPDKGMERFRIEVGHSHKVKPGNIVGAIANEAGLESKYIGKIAIFDRYSTIDLPEGMPREIFRMLKKVWVAGQQLQISRLEDREFGKSRKASKSNKPRKNGSKTKLKGKKKRNIALVAN